MFFQEILFSDSSETSDEEESITEDDFKQMLQLHKEQKLARRKYLLDKNVRYCLELLGLVVQSMISANPG